MADAARDDLSQRLARLGQFFDLDRLSDTPTALTDIGAYYRANRLAYTLFHSRANVLHMGISRDGTFREDDFFEQCRHVDRVINGRTVACLELAAGRASNSAWLAERHPESHFTALDLADVQLRYARKTAARLPNLSTGQGDYHDLAGVSGDSVDIVFNIEGLCYSTNKARVFAEVFRVLKPGGSFLIYDGYSDRPLATRTREEAYAARLLERGMAIAEFERYSDMIATALSAGFDLADEENLSGAIMPSALRLEHRATRLLDLGPLAHLVIRLLPDALINNVVTAYLMPVLIRRHVFSYMATVLSKPAE